MSQTLAIIGTGNVGAALGERFAAAGFPIVYGVRSDKDRAALVERIAAVGGKVEFASPAAAAAAADIVFLAVPGPASLDAARGLDLAPGKILIDCNNPLRWDAGPVWNPPAAGSITAELAAALPGVHVLKAFNGFGAEFHLDPVIAGQGVTVFMAGDEASAKQRVAEVARTAGFSPIDAGPLRNAAVLENVAMLWIHLALVGGQGRQFALQLVRRGS